MLRMMMKTRRVSKRTGGVIPNMPMMETCKKPWSGWSLTLGVYGISKMPLVRMGQPRLGFSYYLVKKITWRACKDLMGRLHKPSFFGIIQRTILVV